MDIILDSDLITTRFSDCMRCKRLPRVLDFDEKFMASTVIWTILGLLCAAGADVHVKEGGEGGNAIARVDIVSSKDPDLGLKGEDVRGFVKEGEEVMGRNLTFELSGFSLERKGEELSEGDDDHEEGEEEEFEEDHGAFNSKVKETWIEGAFIEGVQRFVLIFQTN